VVIAAAAPAAGQPAPDFLFGSPNGMIGFRTGLLFPAAGSDIFTFVQDQLTLDKSDFNAPAIGVDVEVPFNPRASAVIGFEYSKSSESSEYRDFVDNQRLPITQTTSLREFNFSGSVKLALTPRGREISSRAWIPAAVTPYVGAGGGILQHEFLQYGDFIDVEDLEVFPDTFRSSGWSPSAHVFGGVDIKVWKRLYLSGEARYLWSKADLSSDFSGFDPIDLAGFKATVGIHYMF
jgi:hypothetical protein